jgi:multiple antibiotic resistance protein
VAFEGLLNADMLFYAITLLFFIFDPFASLPIFISLTKTFDDREKTASANKAILVAGVLFVIFSLIGQPLLDAFGITIDGFRIAGGIVLLLMSIEIIFGLSITKPGQTNVAWVIVATPILTGPGVIATAILLTSIAGVLTTLIAGAVALVVTWVLMRNSVRIVKFLGQNVIEISSKIIGLLIAAVSIEYVLQGATDWIKTHSLVILGVVGVPGLPF